MLNNRSIGFTKLKQSQIPVLCWCSLVDLFKSIAESHKELACETNCICKVYCLSKWPMKCIEGDEIADFMASLFSRYFVRRMKTSWMCRPHICHKHRLSNKDKISTQFLIENYTFESVFLCTDKPCNFKLNNEICLH